MRGPTAPSRCPLPFDDWGGRERMRVAAPRYTLCLCPPSSPSSSPPLQASSSSPWSTFTWTVPANSSGLWDPSLSYFFTAAPLTPTPSVLAGGVPVPYGMTAPPVAPGALSCVWGRGGAVHIGVTPPPADVPLPRHTRSNDAFPPTSQRRSAPSTRRPTPSRSRRRCRRYSSSRCVSEWGGSSSRCVGEWGGSSSRCVGEWEGWGSSLEVPTLLQARLQGRGGRARGEQRLCSALAFVYPLPRAALLLPSHRSLPRVRATGSTSGRH